MVGKREGEPGAESRGFVPAGPIATLSSLKDTFGGPGPWRPPENWWGAWEICPGFTSREARVWCGAQEIEILKLKDCIDAQTLWKGRGGSVSSWRVSR